MKKTVCIICLCLVLPIIYLIIRSGVNLHTALGLEGMFNSDDFIFLTSRHLAGLYSSIIWLVMSLYIIVFCLHPGTIEEISNKIYKPITQAIIFAINAILSFICFFTPISGIELVTILTVIPLSLIVIATIINIVRLIKIRKTYKAKKLNNSTNIDNDKGGNNE